MSVMKTMSSGPAAWANVVKALVTSSRVARPDTRTSPSIGASTR
jgi:hypothetical protein